MNGPPPLNIRKKIIIIITVKTHFILVFFGIYAHSGD